MFSENLGEYGNLGDPPIPVSQISILLPYRSPRFPYSSHTRIPDFHIPPITVSQIFRLRYSIFTFNLKFLKHFVFSYIHIWNQHGLKRKENTSPWNIFSENLGDYGRIWKSGRSSRTHLPDFRNIFFSYTYLESASHRPGT